MKENLENISNGNERHFVFWNCAGLLKKDRDFWDFIEKNDFISLCETWLDEKGMDKFIDNLSNEFIWHAVAAVKEKRKGRAKKGFLIGIRKNMLGNGKKCEVILDNDIVKTKFKLTGDVINV